LIVGFEVFTAVVMKSIIFWDMKLNGLHGVISQKTILFKISIVLHVSTARQQLARVLYRLHGDSYWTVRWWGNASGQ
jgi:hypothetical protein